MALLTLSSLSLQVAIKNWLLYDLSHLDGVPPVLIREILRHISPWQLYRSNSVFEAYGIDTASVWMGHCYGFNCSPKVHLPFKLQEYHSIVYHLQENLLSVDDVFKGLAGKCLEIGFHTLIHAKDLGSILYTSYGQVERVTENALMSSDEALTLFWWPLLDERTAEEVRPQLADFLNHFNLLSPRKLKINAERFHRATFYWLPFIGPTLEKIEVTSWKWQYATDGVRLLDALMSYGMLKSLRVSDCDSDLRDWFRFLSVAIGHSVHCLDGFHASDDDSFYDVNAREPKYVWHSQPQLDVSKPAIPGLTCVCGPNMRQALTSFSNSMDCHVEHLFLALHSILPHWYSLEELQLEECGDCPWLLARIARQTAAPYRLSKIRLTFQRGVNRTKLFHVLTSELGKYVSEQNSIKECDVRFPDIRLIEYSDGSSQLVFVPCIVYCESLHVTSLFSDSSFNMQTAAQIRRNTSLKRLELVKKNRFDDDNISDLVIAGLLDIHNSLIEELSLQCMHLRPATLRMLMSGLSEMRHLKKLDLSRSLEEDALHMFSNGEFFAALQQLPSLRVLILERIGLGVDALALLTSLINADGSNATQLQVLWLRHNLIHVVPLMDTISRMHQLRQGRPEKLLDDLEFGSLDLCATRHDEARYVLAVEQLASMVNESDFFLRPGHRPPCYICWRHAVEHFMFCCYM